ncbi:hypothetical protein Bca4012_018669 [Brassica carinata]
MGKQTSPETNWIGQTVSCTLYLRFAVRMIESDAMVLASRATELSIRGLSAAVVELVNRLNHLTNSMDLMIQWRLEAEKHAEKMSNDEYDDHIFGGAAEQRLPMEDNQQLLYQNPSKQPIQVHKSTSEPGRNDTMLGYWGTNLIMPNHDSLVRKVDMPLFDG